MRRVRKDRIVAAIGLRDFAAEDARAAGKIVDTDTVERVEFDGHAQIRPRYRGDTRRSDVATVAKRSGDDRNCNIHGLIKEIEPTKTLGSAKTDEEVVAIAGLREQVRLTAYLNRRPNAPSNRVYGNQTVACDGCRGAWQRSIDLSRERIEADDGARKLGCDLKRVELVRQSHVVRQQMILY